LKHWLKIPSQTVLSQEATNLNVGVIIPAWNEGSRIGQTLAAIRGIPEVTEVLVVDDGSSDNTAQAAREAGATVLTLPENGGKGHALQVGIAHSQSDLLLLLDADLGESAIEARFLLRPVVEGEADMTIARFKRTGPASFGLVRNLARWGIRHLSGMVTESPLSGQRCVRRNVFDQVKLANGWGIEVALTIDTIRRGFRVVEVPVEMGHHQTGRDWRGFVHRGKQFSGVLQALLRRLFFLEGLPS
jgi:glycosyltransferase involved in cell wall biosynthesis